MDENLVNAIKKAKLANGNDELLDAMKSISQLIISNSTHIQLLESRAELNVKLQKFGLAINDYRTIHMLNPSDTKAQIRIDQLTTILKYQNTDIFENPNTSFDPWFDD